MNKRLDIIDRKEEIIDLISKGTSKADICKYIKCKQDTLNSHLKRMGIVYAGKQGNRKTTKRKSLAEYLQSSCIQAGRLRMRLLREGIKKHQCEICNNSEWNEKPIPLELDHIDGNKFNNNLSNIRLICPNCHAQTDTHAGKNVGRYHKN